MISTEDNVIAAPPSGRDIAAIPKEDRRSVRALAQYCWEQYRNGLQRRRPHAISWLMVQSFLRGVHYFTIDGRGFWQPIAPEEGELRGVVPLMVPRYRHALGFFNSTPPGVNVSPLAGGTTPVYSADRAQAILDYWIQDAGVVDFQDRLHQLLLTEGMAGCMYYLDPFRQQVFLKALPGSELFPIPYDANDPSEIHGLMHVTMVTKQWLEQQDENFERLTGKKPPNPMLLAAKKTELSPSIDLPGFRSGGRGGKFDGALAVTVWMAETESTPGGEYLFMLGDDAYRHAVGVEQLPQGQSRPAAFQSMPTGKIPVRIAYFDKQPKSFWGQGLCEAMIPSQIAANRQMTALERNARDNRGLTFFDQATMSSDDVQNSHTSLIPFNGNALEASSRRAPVFHFPATPTGRDVSVVLDLSLKFADSAAGFHSGLVFGQAEGRVEGGPGMSLMNQNAMASFVPAQGRLDRMWDETFKDVLDCLRYVWPAEKTIRVSGTHNIGRELRILRDGIPWSRDVILRAMPMLPGGRNAMASMLFSLRQIPGADGKPGTELSSRELRAGLQKLNMLPPGIDMADKAESRIQTRINLLINDGQTPSVQPSDPSNVKDRLVMEDHRTAVEMYKNIILDDSFLTYGPPVQKALYMQLEFHRQRLMNGTADPNSFDDDITKFESNQMEQYLSAAEADLETQEGEFTQMIGA